MDMSRREALHRLAALTGGVVSAPVIGALASGLRAESAPAGWTPLALTPRQADDLGTLVELIIPTTDTPGARAAGVPGFIDKLLSDWVDPDDRTRFVEGLEAVAPALHGAPPGQQQALVTRLDREAIDARRTGVRPLPFFATLKEWTIVGYYTSEIGATQELRWLAAPGRYDADVPLSEVGRTWA